MTYSAECIDKRLPRGNSRDYAGFVTGSDGLGVDLTDSVLIFEMKRRPEPRRLLPTDLVVVSKTSDDANEIEVLDQGAEATKGRYVLKLVPEDTEFLAPGTYAYSIDIRTATGRRYTVTSGRFFLEGPATAEENLTLPCR
jgi:hypothetical protein